MNLIKTLCTVSLALFLLTACTQTTGKSDLVMNKLNELTSGEKIIGTWIDDHRHTPAHYIRITKTKSGQYTETDVFMKDLSSTRKPLTKVGYKYIYENDDGEYFMIETDGSLGLYLELDGDAGLYSSNGRIEVIRAI